MEAMEDVGRRIAAGLRHRQPGRLLGQPPGLHHVRHRDEDIEAAQAA